MYRANVVSALTFPFEITTLIHQRGERLRKLYNLFTSKEYQYYGITRDNQDNRLQTDGVEGARF